jgi:hypothetical protein
LTNAPTHVGWEDQDGSIPIRPTPSRARLVQTDLTLIRRRLFFGTAVGTLPVAQTPCSRSVSRFRHAVRPRGSQCACSGGANSTNSTRSCPGRKHRDQQESRKSRPGRCSSSCWSRPSERRACPRCSSRCGSSGTTEDFRGAAFRQPPDVQRHCITSAPRSRVTLATLTQTELAAHSGHGVFIRSSSS